MGLHLQEMGLVHLPNVQEPNRLDGSEPEHWAVASRSTTHSNGHSHLPVVTAGAGRGCLFSYMVLLEGSMLSHIYKIFLQCMLVLYAASWEHMGHSSLLFQQDLSCTSSWVVYTHVHTILIVQVYSSAFYGKIGGFMTAMVNMSKYCNLCRKTKSAVDFHKQKSKPDGLQSGCITCKKSRRKYNKSASLKHVARYKMLYPKKRKAHKTIQNAVRAGRVVKQPCLVCGDKKSEAHHCDYNKPLDVDWLCRQHHVLWHKHYTPLGLDWTI